MNYKKGKQSITFNNTSCANRKKRQQRSRWSRWWLHVFVFFYPENQGKMHPFWHIFSSTEICLRKFGSWGRIKLRKVGPCDPQWSLKMELWGPSKWPYKWVKKPYLSQLLQVMTLFGPIDGLFRADVYLHLGNQRFTLYHGKPPSNHHSREYFWKFFQASKGRKFQEWWTCEWSTLYSWCQGRMCSIKYVCFAEFSMGS